MNAHSLATAAYGANTPVQSPQSTEYRAFARVTERLVANLRAPQSFPELTKAVAENRRLWNILAADVADKNNQLPQSLRASIFFLAEFTEKHSREVLKGNADVRPLVEINSSVM